MIDPAALHMVLLVLTFDPRNDRKPVWTPDGRRIVFASDRDRDGIFNLYWQVADGTGQAERQTTSANTQLAESFSPDGKRLLLRELVPMMINDLLVLPLEGERRATPLVATKFNELAADVSPDGRWLAYQSNDSGPPEVFVRPFPDVNSGRWQISTIGGIQPLWSRDGRELFFLAGPQRRATLMAVAIQSGASFKAGTPQNLIDWQYGPNYDVSLDGKRFLAIKNATPTATGEPSAVSPFIIVLNWLDELKRLVPSK